MIDVKSLNEKELKQLFSNKKYQHLELVQRGFSYPAVVRKNAILFIGLNPSFTKGSESKKSKTPFYELAETGNYRYFTKFERLSKELGEPWTHIDMLALRETKQSKVKALIQQENGTDFILENLNLSKRILDIVEPKIIVVQNSLARTFLGRDIQEDGNNKWLGYKFRFDPELGTDRLISTNKSLDNKPVFFTSMLTGQRALDNGSYERLAWHMHKALDM
jgi:hypothetical protein